MSTTIEPTTEATPLVDKGLKAGALGLISSTVVGVASTAPAYSLAATLGFVVVAIGLQAPIVTILAFVPMFFVSLAFQQMNKADPDCGASFTWATRALAPAADAENQMAERLEAPRRRNDCCVLLHRPGHQVDVSIRRLAHPHLPVSTASTAAGAGCLP